MKQEQHKQYNVILALAFDRFILRLIWLQESGWSPQRCSSGHAQSSAQQQSMEEKGMASIYRQTFGKNISVRHGECGDEAEAVADPNPHRVVAHTTSYITTLRPGCRLLVSFYSSV